MTTNNTPRRPIRARDTRWATAIARRLAAAGISPNMISVASVFFATAAGAAAWASVWGGAVRVPLLFVLAAIFIQCRLLCNLFDGMVAIEGGRRTNSGEIFNDMPDRIADPFVFVLVGLACQDFPFGVTLGWLAALLAVLTAYVRVLAGSAGAPQRFLGPMAKQHRMALLTIALLLAAALYPWGYHSFVLGSALALVVLGSLITVIRRAIVAVRDLEAR